MKKILKLSIVLIIIMEIFLATNVFASTSIDTNFFKPGDLSGEDLTKTKDIAGNILGIVSFVGGFVAVGCLIILGIKYMTGSLEEKADYKKTMIPYLIGIVLLFSITVIVPAIYDMIKSIG